MHLLAEIEYEPASVETKTVTGTDPADADATNLAITFTPTTSRVLVVLEGYTFAGGVAGDQVHVSWNLREGSSDVVSHNRIMRTIVPIRCYWSQIIDVTPDVELTWKWGLRSSSATIGVNLRMGGTGSGATGPATMRVYSIADGTDDLLGLVEYDPDPAETPTTTSNVYVDVDATNLAVTFDAPASGFVIVELEAYAHVAQRWTLREGTTDLTADGSAEGMQAHASDNIPGRIHLRYRIAVTGTVTWKWGWRRNVGTAALFYGTDYGPAQMRVWAEAA